LPPTPPVKQSDEFVTPIPKPGMKTFKKVVSKPESKNEIIQDQKDPASPAPEPEKKDE